MGRRYCPPRADVTVLCNQERLLLAPPHHQGISVSSLLLKRYYRRADSDHPSLSSTQTMHNLVVHNCMSPNLESYTASSTMRKNFCSTGGCVTFKIRCQHIWYLVRAHFLVQNWPCFFTIFSHRGRVTGLSGVSFVFSCFSHVQLFATPWTPLSMGFSRQAYWRGL